MQPVAAQTFIIEKFAAEVNPMYTYHNVHHVRAVFHHAALIGEKEGISGTEMELLLTAAAFHDSGFLEKSNGHEEVSCNYARQYLPAYDFEQTDIDAICELIMATKIPQTPKSKLGQILCDADLYYLGTDDYATLAEKLYVEYLKENVVDDKMDWQRQQIAFLKQHQYFTKTAKELLSDKRDKTELF